MKIEKDRCAALRSTLVEDRDQLPGLDSLLGAVGASARSQASADDVEAGAVAAVVLEGLSANLGGSQ